MRTLIALTLGVCGICPLAITQAPAPVTPPAQRPAGIECLLLGGHYGGTVSEVTDTSISVVYHGGKIEYGNAAGQTTKVEVIPPQPPRPFQVNASLAAGKFPDSRGAPYSYRLSDVRVGDHVGIECSQENGVDVCNAISISRRPGGRVPRAPGENYNGPLEIVLWHEQCNAIQDWEEKRIPIPDKFHPGGNEAGIAPPPRLVYAKP